MSSYLDPYFFIYDQANHFYEIANRFYKEIWPVTQTINAVQNLNAVNGYIESINSTTFIITSLETFFRSTDFSAILSEITFQDEYTELSEDAAKVFSQFANIVPEKESKILSVVKTTTNNPKSTKLKISRGELIGILVSVLFGILALLQNEIHHAQDSADQQQQRQIENEQRNEIITKADTIIDYLAKIMADSEKGSTDLLPSAAAFQEVPAVPDSVPTSDDNNP